MPGILPAWSALPRRRVRFARESRIPRGSGESHVLGVVASPHEAERSKRRPILAMHDRLFVLVGDSIDRETVRSQCRTPMSYVVDCAKCLMCVNNDSGTSTWLNVMLFGVGSRGCIHRDRSWAPEQNREVMSVTERVLRLLPHVLIQHAQRHREVVVTLHTGLWDVFATEGSPTSSCGRQVDEPNGPTIAPFITGEWGVDIRDRLIRPVLGTVRSYAPHAIVAWRSLPFNCWRGWGDVRTNIVLASHLGVQLACIAGLPLLDWRALSCSHFRHEDLAIDLTHFNRRAHAVLARTLVQRDFVDPCVTTQEQCELSICGSAAGAAETNASRARDSGA